MYVRMFCDMFCLHHQSGKFSSEIYIVDKSRKFPGSRCATRQTPGRREAARQFDVRRTREIILVSRSRADRLISDLKAFKPNRGARLG